MFSSSASTARARRRRSGFAYHLNEHGRSADRRGCGHLGAAAEEQLEIWADRAQGASWARARGDPAAVAYDAIEAASARGRDIVVVDTAGRLHTQTNLMEELAKIRRVIENRLEGAPHETLLVVDATTGQNGVRQAQLFGEAVEVSGVALTKLDGSAKGGVALAIAHELGLPVKLVGVGEGIEDLEALQPPRLRARSADGLALERERDVHRRAVRRDLAVGDLGAHRDHVGAGDSAGSSRPPERLRQQPWRSSPASCRSRSRPWRRLPCFPLFLISFAWRRGNLNVRRRWQLRARGRLLRHRGLRRRFRLGRWLRLRRRERLLVHVSRSARQYPVAAQRASARTWSRTSYSGLISSNCSSAFWTAFFAAAARLSGFRPGPLSIIFQRHSGLLSC